MEATLDAGRPAPAPFELPPGGGALPADWRGVTSLRITAAQSPVARPPLLLEICWVDEVTLTRGDSRQNAIDLVTESASSWSETWTLLTPALYRLTCTGRAYRDGVEVASETQVGYFRCTDPPADLTPYVAATVPAAGQRPVFRQYDLSFSFRETYVEDLYGGALTAIVVDEDGAAAPGGSGTWAASAIGPDVGLAAWCQHVNALGIAAPATEDLATPGVLTVSLADVSLEPGRRYRARLTTDADSLHEVAFVASLFDGFAELVASFDGTVWDEPVTWADPAAALDELAAIAAEPPDTTGARFDRAYVGAFGVAARAWSAALEVRALRGGAVCYGLVVDLPESVEPARLAIAVSAPSGRPVALPSPDGSRILILILGGADVVPVAAGAYRVTLTFRRALADGSLPTLTRAGSWADEVAAIAFNLE